MASACFRPWVWDILRPLVPIFGEVGVLSLFVNLLALAVPVFVMQVYDRVIFHGGLNTLVALFLGMVLVLTFDFVLRQARARILQTIALRIDATLGRALFTRLVSLPLPFVESRSSAFWHALFRDIDIVRNTLSGAAALTFCDLLFFFLFLILTFLIARPVAGILLGMMPLIALIAWRSTHVVKQSTDRERSLIVGRDTLVAEIVAGRTTVRALALDQTLQPLWEERHASTLAQSISRGGAADRYTTLSMTLTLLTTIIITSVGALEVLDHRLTVGALIAANMLAGRLMAPITQMGLQWRALGSLREALDRLDLVIAATPERQQDGLRTGRPAGHLAVEDVVFAHKEGAGPTLDSLRVSFPPTSAQNAGGIHAIVGRNGSGKSTLLKVVMGLYQPARGRVLLDGADIAQFSRRQITRWIGYLPQDTVLFAGTIRYNIALRIPDASVDEITRAAERAGAHSFIIECPDGYDTEVGETGQRLSAGQRQRIAIARALVGQPPLLVLDEPSTALDLEADAELRSSLSELAKTTTIIIVTHGLPWLGLCQSITILDQGRIFASDRADVIMPMLTEAGHSRSRPRTMTASDSANITDRLVFTGSSAAELVATKSSSAEEACR